MSKAVDLSAIVTAISVAGAAVAVVLYFKDDQARQDTAHAKNADTEVRVVELREEQTASDLDTRYWRISAYRQMKKDGECDDGCQARLDLLERDAERLSKKQDALAQEKALLRGTKK